MKKLFVFLGFLCVLLLVINTFLLLKMYCKGHAEKFRKNAAVTQPLPAPNTSLPASWQKNLAGQAEPPKSLGEKAGEAAGQFQNRAEADYAAAQARAKETAAEFEKNAQETAKIFREQAEKTSQELQLAVQQALEVLNQELIKFNEALRKAREQKTNP